MDFIGTDNSEFEKFYSDIRVGSQIWVPCAGNIQKHIPFGHVGEVRTVGKPRRDSLLGFKMPSVSLGSTGEFITRDEAMGRDIVVPKVDRPSSTICPKCRS